MSFRPALRPGAMVLRRDARHLQVGTSPGVVLSDRPGLLALLLDLDGRHDVTSVAARHPDLHDTAAVLQHLTAVGAVVDAGPWDHRHRSEARALTLAGRTPELDARHRTTVAVHHDVASTAFADLVRDLLESSGVPVDAPDARLLVVVSAGEPGRDAFDAAVRQGVEHLVVRLVEDRVLVGPTVVPGHAPCLHCDDLQRAEADPAWHALLPQLGRRAPHHNPPAVAALTAHTAAVEVAAAVQERAAGRRGLVGRIAVTGPSHGERVVRRVPFHPACACTLLPTR